MMSCLITVPSQIKISHDYSTFKICVYVNVYHPTLPLEDANCTVIVSELVKKLSCLLLNPKFNCCAHEILLPLIWQVEMSGQPHHLAALPPGKEFIVPFQQEAAWITELMDVLERRRVSCLAGFSTLDHPAISLVAVYTLICICFVLVSASFLFHVMNLIENTRTHYDVLLLTLATCMVTMVLGMMYIYYISHIFCFTQVNLGFLG